MTAVAMPPAMSHNNNGIIQMVNENNLGKIESFLNDTAYREAIENSSNYNSRLCRERRLRMPFLDSQTGVAQNHSALFMSSRERLPGLLHGQIYTYPSKRWRKKRRQYLMHYLHPKRGPRGDTEDGTEGVEAVTHINDDSKDSVVLKDEHSKDAWYYDEQDMLDMDAYEEPDPDSDYDYEESYSSKRKRRKTRGGGHHPARSHPPSTDTPGGKRTKGGGRGRKKANYDSVDTDKPFVCDLCSARYKTRPGLVYHYGHSHSTSSGDPAKELSPSPAEVEPRSVADTAASNQPANERDEILSNHLAHDFDKTESITNGHLKKKKRKRKKSARESKKKIRLYCIYHIKPVCMVHQLMTAKRNCGYVDRFVIRWYASGSSERYVLEYLESFPGGSSRRIRCWSGVAAVATIAAATAAASIRTDARRSSVAYHLGDQGRSSACRVLARRHRRPVALVHGVRAGWVAQLRWRSSSRRRRCWRSRGRRTDRGEEARRQVIRGTAVPVLRLLPG
ncbi:uncharacterized protein D4 isoform X3 [Anoplolepis gracilipes]|uniref:uncharacterized protein D4 isoform X3 n=1 Tax=Anoplolepis gracilipes TaxID=354296 RepID=UPI003BA38D92